jgi:hypothetical protein
MATKTMATKTVALIFCQIDACAGRSIQWVGFGFEATAVSQKVAPFACR